ncbi:MAG TPA: hypothetical protein VN739_04065 [Nitrososphaerales archaeon]|nr:hypothetical protein [Nitrososphaerales archaeon]
MPNPKKEGNRLPARKYDPGLDLFGNSVSFSIDNERLNLFLDSVHSFLKPSAHRYRARFQEMSFNYEESLPNILYASMISAAVSLLEHQIRIVAEVLRKASGFPLSWNDVSGSLLERFSEYLNAAAGIRVDTSTALWQDVSGSIAIRNCLVHGDGNVADRHGQSDKAVSFIKRHKHDKCIVDKQVIPDDNLAHKILKVSESGR